MLILNSKRNLSSILNNLSLINLFKHIARPIDHSNRHTSLITKQAWVSIKLKINIMGLRYSTNPRTLSFKTQIGLLLTVLVPCSLYLVRGSGASHNEPWGKSRHSPCLKLSVPNPTLKSSDTLYNIRLYVTLNRKQYLY